MLHAEMKNWIGTELGCSNIIIIDKKIQLSSTTVFAAEWYSALVEDLTTVYCFIELQDSRFLPG